MHGGAWLPTLSAPQLTSAVQPSSDAWGSSGGTDGMAMPGEIQHSLSLHIGSHKREAVVSGPLELVLHHTLGITILS